MKFESLARMTKVALAAGALALAGCATSKVALNGTGNLAAAQGIVKASPTANDNTSLDITVQHLAQPNRVEPGATTYVVWARPQGSDMVQNLGALKVDGNLTGQLKTVTPYESFELFITAEPTAAVSRPRGDQVLTAYVSSR
jgi:hypothetical protein